jgi:glutamyl-tRNA reductase
MSNGIIVSTCNRTEVFTISADSQNDRAAGLSFLENCLGIENSILRQYAYNLEAKAAVEHLFRIASGLDSMIIGEYEILGQLRQALEASEKAGMVNLPLRHIFQSAIHNGRRVREETGISKNALSISSVAVDLAAKAVGRLENARLMVIGAGEAGRLVARAALNRGISQIVVASRTREKASSLTDMLGGTAISLKDAVREICHCNIIVTCANAPHSLLTVNNMKAVVHNNPRLPLVIIDIAVPRNVEPEVAQIEGVLVYNIDDLYLVHKQNRHQRESEIKKAEEIVSEEMAKFTTWWQDYKIRPLVRSMMNKADSIRTSQLKRTIKKMPSLSDADRYHLEMMTKAIVTKILNDPIDLLKQRGQEDDVFVKSFKELFRLNKPDQ